MSKKLITLILLTMLTVFILTACAAGAGDPAKTAEAYWNALVAQDGPALSNLSCAAFEQEALITMESFKAIETIIENLSCTAATSGEEAVATCTGKIIASYGAEKLVIDLAQRNYALVKEGGDWRMCGAK